MYNYATGNFDEILRMQRGFYSATADAAPSTTISPALSVSTASEGVVSAAPRVATMEAATSTQITPAVMAPQTISAPVASKTTTAPVSTPRYVPPAYAKPIEEGGVDVNAQIASGMRSGGGGGGGSAPGEDLGKEVKGKKSFFIWGLLIAAGVGAYIKFS